MKGRGEGEGSQESRVTRIGSGQQGRVFER
jgi:hypothetical protein